MIAIYTAWSLGALLGVIGVVQIAGPRFLYNQYQRWDYPQAVRRVTGFLDVAAAGMIVTPSLRGWGIALTGILCFGSIVTLLNHRQYACGVVVILMMAALLPATLAVPRDNQVRFVTSELQEPPVAPRSAEI